MSLATNHETNGQHHPQNAQKLLKTLDGISAESFNDAEERAKAMVAAYSLVSRLETPWETVCRLCMGQPALGAALKIGKDLRLYETWHEHGDREMTSKQLAEMVGCEERLLARLLRHLAANYMLHETSVGVFKPTEFTLALLQPIFGEWVNHLYDATLPCFLRLPEYLLHTGYKMPLDPAAGVFQYTKSWKGDLFDYYASHPHEGESFNHVMGGVMAHQAGWLDVFPHEMLLANADPELPLLVDVGGNIGHDLERFRQAHPETTARLYLEDRPEVVKHASSPDLVNKIGYDFFTPQPIEGARAYYLHGVLHDWPDSQALEILRNLRPALTPNYSSVLIHDHIAPGEASTSGVSQATEGAALPPPPTTALLLPPPIHPHTTAYDLTMMVMVAGQERSEKQWRELLAEAGLEVVNVWRNGAAVQGVIEARVVSNPAI